MSESHLSRRKSLISGFGDPILCFFCEKEVTKLEGKQTDSLHIHSLDGDHENWNPTNKVPAHLGCHISHHKALIWFKEHPETIPDPGQVGRPRTYITEYDLPSGNIRKRFYRAVKRRLILYDMPEVGWSTGSVVKTEDRSFAFFIWREARLVGGKANVYEAVLISETPEELRERLTRSLET